MNIRITDGQKIQFFAEGETEPTVEISAETDAPEGDQKESDDI